MGTGASAVAIKKEEVEDLAEGTVFSEREIKYIYKRFTVLDPSYTSGALLDDVLHLPEFALNPVAAGLVPLYATWDEENPKDRDKARVHLNQFVQLMSLLNRNTSDKEKLQKMFLVFDGDGDGKLCDADLFQAFKMFVGNQQTDIQIRELVDSLLYKEGVKRPYLPITEFIQLIPRNELREKLTVDLPT